MTFQSFPIETEKMGTTSNFHLATAESSSWWVQASVHRGKKGFFGRMRIEWTTWSHLLDKLWAGSPRPKRTLNLKPTCLFFGGFERRVGMEKGDDTCDVVLWEGCFEGVSQVFEYLSNCETPEALSESPLNVWVLNGLVGRRGDRMSVTERC